jgi:hypothetical protein
VTVLAATGTMPETADLGVAALGQTQPTSTYVVKTPILLLHQATPERGFVSHKSRAATRTLAASPLLANAKLPGCASRGVSQ